MSFEKLHRYLHKYIHPFEHLGHGAIIAIIVFALLKLELFIVFLESPKLRWSTAIVSFVITVISSFYYERNILKIAKRKADWV
ncbi:MAG: hypothetical protein HY438_03575 [DPANN group archaeon]|nr:hypothetical protein [DPANN group archaeon]